jgi:hypothetical protein
MAWSVSMTVLCSADPTSGWLGANETIGMALSEFYRQFLKRQKGGNKNET